MKFFRDFLINFAIYAIGLAIIYFIGHDLINAGFQVFSAFFGPVLPLVFFFLLVIIAALPRRR
jgi:hypothetical protein